MICKNCGKTILNDSVFCKFCGYQVKSDETITKTINKHDGKLKIKSLIKKVFKKPSIREIVIASLLILVLGCSITGLILQDNYISDLSQTIANQKSQIEQLDSDKTVLTQKNNELQSKIKDYKTKYDDYYKYMASYDFLLNKIAFVVDEYNSKYYHTCDCNIFKNGDSYWAYNVEMAQAKGYSPCPYCH